jgi:hypothetical protein
VGRNDLGIISDFRDKVADVCEGHCVECKVTFSSDFSERRGMID